MEFTVQQVSDLLGGSVDGNGQGVLRDLGRIEVAQPGQLAFLSNPTKYESFVYESKATAILVPTDWQPTRSVAAALIRVHDVASSYASLMRVVAENLPKPDPGVDSLAFVHPTAQVEPSAHVGAFAYVGAGAVIGAHSILEPHSFVGSDVRLGEACLLQSGARMLHGCIAGSRVRLLANAVVGADGFGHTKDASGAWVRIPHLGNVVLEDDVEVGACSTIDRASTGSTILRQGVKLDNLVMIAHNVTVGAHTAAAAQVGVAGSARIGSSVQLGGQVGLRGHISIADGVNIGAQSGIKDDITTPGATYFGSPAKPIREFARDMQAIASVGDLRRQIRALRNELSELRASTPEVG